MTNTQHLLSARTADWRERRRLRAWELHQADWEQVAIAQELGVSKTSVYQWIKRARREGVEALRHQATSQGRASSLTPAQLREASDLLRHEAERAAERGDRWTHARIAEVIRQHFGVSYHPAYIGPILSKIQQALLEDNGLEPYFASPFVMLYRGDAAHVMSHLPDASVDCIVTSPPYYGQRDYGVPGQLGLEKHPQTYIDNLVAVFRQAWRVLKPSGSLWVNIGDTYWSGKGRPHGPDAKQKNRRFPRPQDQTGERPWCAPKQLLLIPHRFAIAMQDEGWIVRNDNVWQKINPMPDPVDDRCALVHEYIFHFVRQKKYHYDYAAVAVPSNGKREVKAPPSVWAVPTASSQQKHIAVFPEQLVQLPIRATCPPSGLLLDPFCGSGTALAAAVRLGGGRRAIGIDISEAWLVEAQELLVAMPEPGEQG